MKTRVFVVDDYPLLREGIAQLINNEDDLEVCGAIGDASDAIALIEKTQPDIALLDISLRDVNGIDLARQLKRTFPRLKLLMLSMHGETMLAQRALSAGASGYMLKEEATDNVLQAIRRILSGDSYVSPEIAASLSRHSSLTAGLLEMTHEISQTLARSPEAADIFTGELRPA